MGNGNNGPPAMERLRGAFESLGLTSSQARVLGALLTLRSAPAAQLPRLAGVHRTSIYGLLEDLQRLGLAAPVAGAVPARWVAALPEEIIRLLGMAQSKRVEAARADITAEYGERMREHDERLAEVERLCGELRELLGSLVVLDHDQVPLPAVPHLRLLSGLHQYSQEYSRLYTTVQHEVMVLNRGPYGVLRVDQCILDALSRGVRIRALYVRSEVDEGAPEFIDGLEVYHAAGVEGRVVDELPMSLSVFDRRIVMISLDDPVAPVPGVGTPIQVDHPQYGEVVAAAFERFWEAGTPYRRGVELAEYPPTEAGEAAGTAVCPPSARATPRPRRGP